MRLRGVQGIQGSDFIPLWALGWLAGLAWLVQSGNWLVTAAAACITSRATYKDRQAKAGATRHEGCAVPPNEIIDNLLACCALAWLTAAHLTSPHLTSALPTLIPLGEDALLCCICLLCKTRDPLHLSHQQSIQTQAAQPETTVARCPTVISADQTTLNPTHHPQSAIIITSTARPL